MSIRLSGVSKSYGHHRAVDDVSVCFDTGELITLLGPSGSGKSTLLRIIAGLETADRGEVWLDGVRADGIDPRDRRVGFVFQNYALFGHMSVADNIGFGLRVRGVSAQERAHRVDELLELLGLSGLGRRTPSQLSGGQRQRVALARAIAPQPRLLLLDEPLGAVDAKVREELRIWLRKVHDRIGATTVLVTHDREEAFSLADRVAVIDGGKLQQLGTPTELLDEPATEFVAGFVGEVNRYVAECRGGSAWIGKLRIPMTTPEDSDTVRVVVRTHEVRIWPDTDGVATVTRLVVLGDRVRVDAELDGGWPLAVHLPRGAQALLGVIEGTRIAAEVRVAHAWPAS